MAATPSTSEPHSWFITGANRGIGLELVTQLTATPTNTVLAACRAPAGAAALHALQASLQPPSRLHILQLDTTDAASVAAAAAQATALLGAHGLDYLVNNAGMVDEGADAGAFGMSVAVLNATLVTNVGGPAAVAQALGALLRGGTVVNVSSSYGSIGLRRFGRAHAAYAVSKAALNMLTYKQAADRADLTVVAITPGWVKTDMTDHEGHFEVADSVANVLKVVHALTPADSGKFLNYDGSVLPW